MDKKISLAIAIFFPALLLGYWLFWFGTIEISVNGEVENFSVELRGGKVWDCQNPCRHRFRAGKRFIGTVRVVDFLPAEIRTGKISFLKTEQISFQLRPIAEAERVGIEEFLQERKKLLEKFSVNSSRQFGPVRVDPSSEFAVFTERQGLELFLRIRDARGSEKVLTVMRGEFSLGDFKKNFTLSSRGVVIPERRGLYFYDFARQRKQKIFDGDPGHLAKISMGADGQFIAYDGVDKMWKTFFPDGSHTLFSEGTRAAAFINGEVFTLSGNKIYSRGRELLRIRESIGSEDEVWFENKALFIQREDEVWRIGVPRM